ncbi:hypothetical protein RHMOL_Rhmol05G0061500 [Rhododendron molle]|uniref:Uncharacterized protein n=1 Tax=Rhododendron molle TaxID=49168 RepID=A0ACC0NM79_RHOML|nr:hypothetical protein RHMOL_Rhmol05G0061500 [Rhododendron molle]
MLRSKDDATGRLGIRSLVLESSESLRVSGFAFTTWTNAWRALDEIGIGDSLRQQHDRLYGIVASSIISGLPTSEMSFTTQASQGDHEVRCVRRKFLLEALQKELPSGTIRFSSKVVSIEEDSGGCFKDGPSCKWVCSKGKDFKGSHGLEPKFLLFVGKGVRCGFAPCNEGTVYWFFTFTSSTKDKEIEKNPVKMKEFVLSNLGKVPDEFKAVVEITELDSIAYSQLRSGRPWELLWANISKGNVCVTGDAFHPMTPDIRQGGCSALEDGVVLARCLAEALRKNPSTAEAKEGDGKEEYERIEMGMKKFAEERKWRGIVLVSTAYMVGFVQQSNGVVVSFLRDKVLGSFMAGLLLKRADFDCGKLSIS